VAHPKNQHSRSECLRAARGAPLPLKVKIMNVASIPQDVSLKHRLASWFVPPIVVPIMLVALIAVSGLYHTYW
jgi:hypothetical protein